MTCYFRQLEEIFQKAGISLTAMNREEIDKTIQSVVGLEGKHCPEVWKEVRSRIQENEAEFIDALKSAWVNRDQK